MALLVRLGGTYALPSALTASTGSGDGKSGDGKLKTESWKKHMYQGRA